MTLRNLILLNFSRPENMIFLFIYRYAIFMTASNLKKGQ